MEPFRARYLGPVALVALCFVTLCTVTAVSLVGRQAEVTRVLRENVESRRAAVELDECLTDLVALENDRVEAVAVLHARVLALLQMLAPAAGRPGEAALRDRLAAAFAEYLRLWRAMPPAGSAGHEAARLAATAHLERAVRQPCEAFIESNARRIERSADNHEHILRQLAWGLAVVGGLGGVAGVAVGFGAARGLSRSIGRLRVQIRHAAGKIGPDESEIVLTGEGGFGGLHAEVEALTGRVGEVVAKLRARDTEILRAEQLAAVGQLAAGVGHEIRNPLTSIKMLVQAGLEDGGGGLTADDLRVIEGEVRRMERSLQTFLDFARPPEAARRPTDIAPVAAGVVGLVRGRAEKQGVAVRLRLPAGGLTVPADGEQLRQVLVNLCLNALDAMPAGGTLSLAARAAPGGRAEVEVADTGPGIPPAFRGRLFEPFASTKETGLGLGLVICRRIVADHGGTIWAGDRPGGGASFLVTLPAATAGGA